MTQANVIFVKNNIEMGAQLFKKYLWIANHVRTTGRITFRELQSSWEKRFESPLSRRTFIHNKEKIQELFDINIACDRRTNEYYIENPEDLKRQNEVNWILNSFSVLMGLIDSRKISNRIVLDEVPSSKYHLNTVLKGIKQNKVLKIIYQPFSCEAFEMNLNPYFVQLSANRWYLYGVREGDAKIKAYALDRFKKTEILNKTFIMPNDFSAETYLQHNGVGQYENIDYCKITLRAYSKQIELLRSLPLHPSQTETKTGEGVAEFTYNLRPTTKFYSDILAAGIYIKVLHPAFVREHIAKIIHKTATYYK